MKKLFFLFSFLVSFSVLTNIYGIQIFLSGIDVDFVSPEKPHRRNMLLQVEENDESLETDRFIRVINGMLDLPEDEYLALVFYDETQRVEDYHIITNSTMPTPDRIFHIDRNSGKYFLGLSDIYSVPKTTFSFGLAVVTKKGKIIHTNFTHPDFDKNGQITLKELYTLPSDKKLMLQYEVIGTYDKPFIKLGAFHFVD